ncbi:D-tyrosyl-tRNA(Tyr) deacylase [Candidatus Peregrinibacteria bacterium]|jgi:D-aminoacyl-tRNA deacylase|nr:D-tyrosyl-tRNA(Tyr) deacylase [Candidatus Peregrinibacteria bacterium]MBT7736349.1 D-tyrosyl-tRNA(Tyr) deacylase [Candidatus Peregrinibacteria bacterium]
MKAVIQKSDSANVKVENKTVGEISRGLVILLGVTENDTKDDVNYLAEKISNMRLFEDEEKGFEKSLLEDSKEALVISQFTLYASTKKGRRPDFNQAAKGDVAEPLYEYFCDQLTQKGIKVEKGVFGAMMKVELTNSGPITIIVDSKEV